MSVSTDWFSYVTRGDLEFSHQRYVAAQEYYEEAARVAPQHRIPHERLGNFYYFSGRMDSSLEHLFKAFELGSGEPLVFFNLGRIFFLGQELLDRGRYFLDRALSLSPGSEPLVGTYLGVLFYLKGRADDSAELLLKLRLASPMREPLEFFLGCSYHDLGDEPHAERHYKHALSIEKSNPETLLMLGNNLFRQKKYDEALGSFNKAMEALPDYSPAWHNAGIALQFLGKTREAADFMRKSHELRKVEHGGKKGTSEEPGLEKQIWKHVERLLLEGTLFRGGTPIVLD